MWGTYAPDEVYRRGERMKVGYKIVVAEDYRHEEVIMRAIQRAIYALQDEEGKLTIELTIGEDDEV